MSTGVGEDGALNMLKKKTSVGLSFGLHWDPKEGYKSMETPGSCFAGLIF